MIKRTVEIATHGCYVHMENSQLVIRKEFEKLGSVPIEDIGVLIVDSPAVTMSSGLVTSLVENNVAVVFTDAKHLPNSLTLPLSVHSTQGKTLQHQIEISLPIKKRVWQQIVSAKIFNQHRALEICGSDYAALREISRNVPSGDPKNIEAFAARIYWRKLFGDEFRRDREAENHNILLNYGYAIIRAAVARAIVGTGLHPGFGVNHKNQYNAFPLADDLMEPLRPFVDVTVFRMVQKMKRDGASPEDLILTRELKIPLLDIIANDCLLDGRKLPLMVALGYYAANLKQIYLGEEKSLSFPTL